MQPADLHWDPYDAVLDDDPHPTWKRLRDHFDFHEPQTLYLKGKGDTVVHRLIGRKLRPPEPAARLEVMAGLRD